MSDLEKIAFDLVDKLEQRNIVHVAISDFEPIDDLNQFISKPLTEDFSVNFLNYSNSIKVYERSELTEVINELKLQQSGLIDESTAKEIGSFTGAEAIISGQYSITSKGLKLWLKVVETESAYQIAALVNEIKYDYKSLNKKPQIQSLKKGSLLLKNNRSYSISVLVEGDNFSKTIAVGPKSKINLTDLTPGLYACKAQNSKGSTTYESFDLIIKANRTHKYKFRPFRLIPTWLTIGLTSVFVIPMAAIGFSTI